MDRIGRYRGCPPGLAAGGAPEDELITGICDGNGRIGRMLVSLVLYEKGLIGSPMS